jgi:hypothetical protein
MHNYGGSRETSWACLIFNPLKNSFIIITFFRFITLNCGFYRSKCVGATVYGANSELAASVLPALRGEMKITSRRRH